MRKIVVTKPFSIAPKPGGPSFRLLPGMDTNHMPQAVRKAAVEAGAARFERPVPKKTPSKK